MFFGKILSIEVGSMYTKVVDVHAQNGKYLAGKSLAILTPPGTYEDGYIRDDETLCNNLFTELHRYGIAKRRVAFTISSSKIINREIVLPAVDKSKIMPMIMANIGDYFPVDISKYKVTWDVMEHFAVDKQKKMKLMVIAVPMDLLEGYYQFAADLGMSVEVIDYSGNSVYQLVKPLSREEAVVSLHLGEDTSIVSVVDNGILELQRTIPYGINVAMQTLAEASGWYNMEGHHEELYNRLKKETLVNAVLHEEAVDENPEHSEIEGLRADVTESFRSLIDRIGRVLHYYASVKPDMKLGKMVLTGPGAGVNGIFPLLQFELGMQVVGSNALKNIKLDPKLTQLAGKQKRTAFEVVPDDFNIDLCEAALCIGAVMAPMDLLSKALQGNKKKRQSMTAAVVCCVSGIMVAGAMAGYAYISQSSANMTKVRLNQQIENLSVINEVLQKHSDVLSVYDSTVDMYDYTRNPLENLVEFIEEMEEKMPSSTQVLSCSLSSSGVSMSIEVGSFTEAADAIAQLKSFECLASVSVSSVTESTEEVTENINTYYVDGVAYDSLDDAPYTEDSSISIETVSRTYMKSLATFSVSCTWKGVSTEKLDVSSNDVDAVISTDGGDAQ